MEYFDRELMIRSMFISNIHGNDTGERMQCQVWMSVGGDLLRRIVYVLLDLSCANEE